MEDPELMGIVAIKPHSADGDALASLDSTFKSLRDGGPLHRVDGEVWIDAAGMVYAEVENPGFVLFAVEHQGYAEAAYDVTGVVELP